jgi:Na+-driven multidrug efflux pump
MGGSGEALANAVLYANVLFAAAVPGWIANLLASALRGAGNVRVPALVTAAGAVATLALSPLFIFGWGFVPAFGVAGAGMALIVFNTGSAIALVLYMRSPQSPLRLGRARLEWRLLADILRVGLPSAAGTIMANLTVVLTTGLVGSFGSDAIAGYGLASRLDYLLIPLLFALGTASVTMVGINVGAGQHARVLRIAWSSALISAAAVEAIGLSAALLPQGWMHLFTRDAEVAADGIAYLTRVAPAYAFFGAGMALYFASQGAGRMLWPFAAGAARLAIVWIAGGYWVGVELGSIEGLFWTVAASYVVFGAVNAVAMINPRSAARLRPLSPAR